MFGIGFTEILLISIIAILFLGPDKLPGAIVEMGKLIKSVKKIVGEAKSSLDEEIKISDLKEEALAYKKQLTDATDELKNFKNISFEDDVSYDEEISKEPPMAHVATTNKKQDPVIEKSAEAKTTQVESKNETVTFAKKTKSKKREKKDDDKGKA